MNLRVGALHTAGATLNLLTFTTHFCLWSRGTICPFQRRRSWGWWLQKTLYSYLPYSPNHHLLPINNSSLPLSSSWVLLYLHGYTITSQYSLNVLRHLISVTLMLHMLGLRYGDNTTYFIFHWSYFSLYYVLQSCVCVCVCVCVDVRVCEHINLASILKRM